jgi:hypothetical protein
MIIIQLMLDLSVFSLVDLLICVSLSCVSHIVCSTYQTRDTAGRRSPDLIHKWNNLTVRYAGLIPPRPHHLN